MPCLASFFDAMSGVKKLVKFIPVINCPASAFEPSTELDGSVYCCQCDRISVLFLGTYSGGSIICSVAGGLLTNGQMHKEAIIQY